MSFSRAHGIVRHEPKGRLHRIAYSEHLEDKKLLRAADRLLNDGARSQQRWEMFEANWQRFRAAFATEYPAVDQIEEKLSMACAAQEVGQEKFYEGHYRTYSGYSHGTLRASMGSFDDLTDPQDNGIMAACASTALDALVPLRAELPNREDLLRRVPYYE